MDTNKSESGRPNEINEIRSSLEVEYTEIHNFLRYLLDYRAKIFNFAILIRYDHKIGLEFLNFSLATA